MYQVRCNGIYSYRITDPILFYKNVCGNVEMHLRQRRDRRTVKDRVYLRTAAGICTAVKNCSFCPSEIPGHVREICEEAMNEALTKEVGWKQRGISVVSVAMNPDHTSRRKTLKKIQEIAEMLLF